MKRTDDKVAWAVALAAYHKKIEPKIYEKFDWDQKMNYLAAELAENYLRNEEWVELEKYSSDYKIGIATYVIHRKKEMNEQIFVGFRGSASAMDWMQNIFGDIGLITLSGITVAERQALNAKMDTFFSTTEPELKEPFLIALHQIEELRAQYPQAHIIVTGHSRGGSQAMYVAMCTGIQAITFNAAPLPIKEIIENEANEKNIRNYYVRDDMTFQVATLEDSPYKIYGQSYFSPLLVPKNEKVANNLFVVNRVLQNHSMTMFLFDSKERIVIEGKMKLQQQQKIKELTEIKQVILVLDQINKRITLLKKTLNYKEDEFIDAVNAIRAQKRIQREHLPLYTTINTHYNLLMEKEQQKNEQFLEKLYQMYYKITEEL